MCIDSSCEELWKRRSWGEPSCDRLSCLNPVRSQPPLARSLQRFKLNIASSVVTQQNSDLSSLGTESILDLFNVSAEDASPVVSKEGPVGQKALLEGLEDLPPEDECELRTNHESRRC